MARRESPKIFYLKGYSGRKGLIGILARPTDFPPGIESTFFYTHIGDEWGVEKFDFDLVSIAYVESTRSWWLAGKRGEIVEVGDDTTIHKIPTADTGSGQKYGYLADIRVIGSQLFVCGYRRQVYVRDGKRWRLISKEILDDRKKGPWIGFESIDGYGPEDLYAVGDEGEIWHYNGQKWDSCESPTNANLSCVRRIGSDLWACGDQGSVLKLVDGAWAMVYDGQTPSYSWWSIEGYADKVFLSGDSFLGVVDGDKISEVRTPCRPTTGSLHAKDGILWSVGERHIFSFDGAKWAEHVAPENA